MAQNLIADARRDGYTKAMQAQGLGAEIRIVLGGQTQLDGQRAARALLAEGDLPTALIAYNDDTAVAAMGLLAQHGIDVPGRMSIIGWDDSEAAALSPVGLTSVAQHPARWPGWPSSGSSPGSKVGESRIARSSSSRS